MSHTKRKKSKSPKAGLQRKTEPATQKRAGDGSRLRTVYSFLKSIKLGMALLAAIAIASAVGTFIQQDVDPQDAAGAYSVLSKLGLTALYHSWWFLCLLGLLVLNAVLCLYSRLRLLTRRPGLLLAHASAVFMAAGALIGARWGVKGFITLREGEQKGYFETRTGGGTRPVPLGFSIGLEEFVLERYDSHSEGVVLVREPGHESVESFPAEVGAVYDVLGAAYALEVLRVIPDFKMSLDTREVTSASNRPNNPAIEIKISRNEERETRWLFAKYPDAHSSRRKLPLEAQYRFGSSGYIKDYKSRLWIENEGARVLTKTIEVNYPLEYNGYSFYQTSYDDKDLSWTGLQVVKDPGIPIMYAGFAMLCVGVTLDLYSRNWRASRRDDLRKEK